MALKILDTLYFILLFATAIKSLHLILNKNNQNSYLFIYLCVVLSQECFLKYQSFFQNYNYFYLYNLFDIFSIIFFTFFYFSHTRYKLITGIGVTALVCYSYFSNNIFISYFDNGGIISAICLLLFSLLDYTFILKNRTIIKITSIPFFWVSTALLLWSVFFLFRLIPRFLFQNIDHNFMEILRSFFQLINVITYALFFIALTKFEKIKV